MTAWHGRRPRLRVIIALAGAISSLVPALVCAAGFSVTRQVTTLDVHRTGHYTETVERTLRIDSPAGIDDHDQWSLTYNPERTKLEIVEAWTQTRSGQRIPVPRNRIMVRERTQADRDYLFSGRVALVVIHPQVEVGSLLHLHWRASHVPIYPGHFAWRRPVDPQDPPGEWTLRMAHEPGMPMRVHQAGFAGGELAPDARGWRRLEFRVDRDAIVRSETQRRRAPE